MTTVGMLRPPEQAKRETKFTTNNMNKFFPTNMKKPRLVANE